MTNKRTTKRALLFSVLSMLLCVSMLMGTTFAWFTDSVSSVNNIIKSGNLDVELYYQNDETADWTKVGADTNIFKENTLWEPGHTEVVKLKVENKGSLALQYKLGLNVASEIGSKNVDGKEFKLSDYIKYALITESVTDRADAIEKAEGVATALNIGYTTAGELYPASVQNNVKEYTLVVYMPESVGNEANYAKGEAVPTINFGIDLFATQYTYEKDSFGDDYDDLTIVTDAADLAAALSAGGTILLANDVVVDADETITVNNGVEAVLDLNGHTIAGTSNQTGSNRNMIDVRGTLTVKNGAMTTVHTGANMEWNNSTNVFNVTAGGVLNIVDATIENNGGSDMAFGVHLNNWGEVTLNVDNSTIFSTYGAIRAFNSGNDMNNITVTNSSLLATRAFWVHNYTAADFGNNADKAAAAAARINCNILIDNPVTGLAADDPANLNAAANNTIVGSVSYGFTNREVYFSTSEKQVASDDSDLDTAIAGGAETVYLASGTYIIPDSAKGKQLTIIGNGETIIASQDDGAAEGDCDYSFDGSTVTFENVTITTSTTYFPGYARMKGIYNNCTINGVYTLYDNSTFNNCTFNVSGDVYNVWTWGAAEATFNGCTFNNDGKAILLYGTVNTKLTVDGCTFNDNGGLTDKKAAVEIGNDYNKSYELIVNNTVVNGYEINDKGINTGTTLWGNKNSMGTDKLNVVVDGVDVY